jgi:hypothetical protein
LRADAMGQCGFLTGGGHAMGGKKRRSAPPKPSIPPKPWYRRGSAWGTGTILGTVIAGVLIAVIVKLLNLNSSDQPATPQSASAPAPLTVRTSGPGLSAKTTIFYIGGQDTTFVTKNGFGPQGQLLALMKHAGSTSNPKLFPTFRGAGAIQAGTMLLRLVLTGESSQGIRILNVTPIIVARTRPWHGDLFSAGPQGSPSNIQTLLNLDNPFPTVRSSFDGKPYFQERTITLRLGEQEVIIMQVTSSHAYFAFKLGVDYLAGSQPHSLILTDQIKPFEISAINCTGNNAWVKYSHVFAPNGQFQYVPYNKAIPCPVN